MCTRTANRRDEALAAHQPLPARLPCALASTTYSVQSVSGLGVGQDAWPIGVSQERCSPALSAQLPIRSVGPSICSSAVLYKAAFREAQKRMLERVRVVEQL